MSRNLRRQRAREIRKRGFILSFGDIILPFVGVVAIGLLVVAGKLFFSNGLQPLPSVASTQQDLEPSAEEALPTVDAGTPTPLPSLGDDSAAQPLSPPSYNIMDIPYGGNAPVQPKPKAQAQDVALQVKPMDPMDFIAMPVSPESPNEAAAKMAPAKSESASSPEPLQGKVVPVKLSKTVKPKANAAQQPASKPAPKATTAKPAPKPSPAKPTPKAPAAAPKTNTPKPAPAPTPAKKPAQPSSSWRVQVGAYGSKQIAEDAVAKLAKSGYSASVFSGPKFHKVWVQAGSTKQAAEATASRLSKGGYPGSYVVPPPAN